MKKNVFFFSSLIFCFLNSCNSQNIQVVNADFLFSDSIIVNNNIFKTKAWFDQGIGHNVILIDDSLFQIKHEKLFSIKNIFGKRANNFYQIGDFIYYESGSIPVNLCTINNDSIKTKIEFSNIFKYHNEAYCIQLFSNNSYIKLINNEIIVPVLYYENLEVKTTTEYFKNANKNRLAHLKVTKDTLELIKMIDFFPRANFFIDEKRCLSYLPNLCSSKQNFYLVYDFLDSVFEYDKSGRLIKSIPLPKELNFFTYDNSYNLFIDQAQTEKAEMIGSKNTKILFDESTQHLLVVTVEGIHQNYNFKLIPSPNDWDWNISIFDLKTNKWLTIIKFDKNHEFRNVMFENGKIYVKRQTGKKLIFDVFTY